MNRDSVTFPSTNGNTVASTAGGSAQAEYERRRARDRDGARARRRSSITLLLATPLVVFGLTHLSAAAADEYVRGATGTVPAQPVLDRTTISILAAVLAASATSMIARALWGPRQTTEAWAKGAEGERLTGQLLEHLPVDSFVTLHDLRIPGSRANIDHVVIGSSGVHTVETKHYRREVTIRNGQVWSGGRSLERVVAQAKRQATVVQEAVGREVFPVVCVHGGGVRLQGWRTRPVIDGVRFCSARQLVQVVTSGPTTLACEDGRAVAARLQSWVRGSVVTE